MNLLSLSKGSLAILLLLILNSCGQATYDNENPEKSLQAIVKKMNEDEKSKFSAAFQKVLFSELAIEANPLSALASLSDNPAKIKQYTACMNGKTAEDIIEMSKQIESATVIQKYEKAVDSQLSAPAHAFQPRMGEARKELEDFEQKMNQAASEIEREFDSASKELNWKLNKFEQNLQQAASKLQQEFDDDDVDSEEDEDIDRKIEQLERGVDRFEEAIDAAAIDELEREVEDNDY